jgi:hypothetical protein
MRRLIGWTRDSVLFWASLLVLWVFILVVTHVAAEVMSSLIAWYAE